MDRPALRRALVPTFWSPIPFFETSYGSRCTSRLPAKNLLENLNFSQNFWIWRQKFKIFCEKFNCLLKFWIRPQIMEFYWEIWIWRQKFIFPKFKFWRQIQNFSKNLIAYWNFELGPKKLNFMGNLNLPPKINISEI